MSINQTDPDALVLVQQLLQFDTTKQDDRTITVSNYGHCRLAVRVKCTNNAAFRVHPVHWFLGSGEEEEVRIRRLAGHAARMDALIIQFVNDVSSQSPETAFEEGKYSGRLPRRKVRLQAVTPKKPQKMRPKPKTAAKEKEESSESSESHQDSDQPGQSELTTESTTKSTVMQAPQPVFQPPPPKPKFSLFSRKVKPPPLKLTQTDAAEKQKSSWTAPPSTPVPKEPPKQAAAKTKQPTTAAARTSPTKQKSSETVQQSQTDQSQQMMIEDDNDGYLMDFSPQMIALQRLRLEQQQKQAGASAPPPPPAAAPPPPPPPPQQQQPPPPPPPKQAKPEAPAKMPGPSARVRFHQDNVTHHTIDYSQHVTDTNITDSDTDASEAAALTAIPIEEYKFATDPATMQRLTDQLTNPQDQPFRFQ